MGIKAIDYENLSDGDLITWYGVHVLQWESDIRPYGIEPTIAFVQDDSQEELIKQLLEALEALVEAPNGDKKAIREAWDKAYDALAAAKGQDND
jgi:hypothetical protein